MIYPRWVVLSSQVVVTYTEIGQLRGWRLLSEWKDGSDDWVPLKDIKQSNPVELAEYAMANEISDEPEFD